MSLQSTSKLEQHIRQRLTEKPILLMTHAVVGYPSLEANWRMLESMQLARVDMVELQLPFSDPVADGKPFVNANQKAISQKTTWSDYFDLLRSAANTFSFPIIFMGYANSPFRMGAHAFCEKLVSAGAAGFIIADLPPREARSLNAVARRQGLDPILMMTTINTPGRMVEIAAEASGFVYCASRPGVTGSETANLRAVLEPIVPLWRAATPLPLGLGFGIRSAKAVHSIRGLLDIAIVGTACLEAWEANGQSGFADFVSGLAAATT